MGKRKARASEVAAIDEIKRLIRITTNKRDYKELASLHNQLGNQYRHLGQFKEAIAQHQEEIKVSKQYNKADRMGLGIAYRNMGEVLTEMKDEAEAIKYINMYLKIARDVGDFVEQQRALITLGNAYLSMTEDDEDLQLQNRKRLSLKAALEKAEACFREAYILLSENELITKVNDEKALMLMKCNNCQNLGLTLESKGSHSDACGWLKKAVDIGKQFLFYDNMAPCYSVLCGIYLKTRQAGEALAAAKSTVDAATKIGNQELQTEASLMHAKALFLNDEIATGKKILKKLRSRIQKKSELHVYMEDLDSMLIAAVKICKAQDETYVTESAEELMKLHEILGDNYSALLNFEVAIAHYKKACEKAEDNEIRGKKLSRLYFSIAECYRDLNNFQAAHKYYVQEIALHSGNAMEEFKTQTNITMVLEKMKKSVDEIVEAHQYAISLAQSTGKLSKVVIARGNFASYLKNTGSHDEAERQTELVDQIKRENNITEVDEPDSQDLLDAEDEIDLDELSDEDESDDERDEDNRSSRKRISTRVNEAGETSLHVAAKRGDLKAVTKLIREGHSVNIKDNCGWTPLHEASNFGHTAVVEKLLKSKADVNDNTGLTTEKVTPLHDAAGNGHCETMTVLLKYGANVLAKDAQGRYPIDSLLAWRETDGRGCSERDLIDYREMRELLKEKMKLAGKPYSAEAEKRSRKKAHRTAAANSTSLLVEKPHDYDCPIPVKITTDPFDLDKEGEGKREYKKVIKHVRRDRNEMVPSGNRRTRALSPGPRGALIPAEKDVHEDWMIPDSEVVPMPSTSKGLNSKRKRNAVEDTLSDEGNGKSRRKAGSKQKQRRKRRHSSENEGEAMEVEYLENSSRSSFTHSPDVQDLLNNEEDDFLNEYHNDFEPSISMHDDFLPSQRPSSSTVTVNFGKTVDIKEVVQVVDSSDGDSENDRENRNTFSRSRQKSPIKASRRIRAISSSSENEDNDVPLNDSQNSNNRLRLSDLSTSLKNTTSRRNQKSMIQTRLPVKVIPKNKSRLSDEYSRDRVWSSPEPDIQVLPTQSTNIRNNSIDSRPRKKEVWRLKVWVDKELLLVPVEENHFDDNIDWLAAECAKRYFDTNGVKPDLTLYTKDGAILSGADRISLVLGTDERELKAKVKKFDLPPLVDRYSSACALEAIEVDGELKSHLNMCQSSNVLNLTDVNLRGKTGGTLMTALQRQSSLNTLILSGCSLFDNGLLGLCNVLPTLCGLQHLDLSSNGITKAGFVRFVEVFTKEEHIQDPEQTAAAAVKVPLGITTLVLSHNPLGNFVGSSLASLLNRLVGLKRLEIADCNFTEKLIAWSRNDLTRALNNSRLEDVDVSYNNLKDVGLEQILQNLPARKLRTLNCSSCAANSNSENSDGNKDSISKSLCTLLSRNEDCCNLSTLTLNDCRLDDKSVELILDAFDRLVRLESLEFSRNDELSALSLTNILTRVVERNVPLTRLDMGNIPNLWKSSVPTDEMILNALEKKMASNKKLAYLRLPTTLVINNLDTELSKLESRIVTLMEDYAGNTRFSYKKDGSYITYQFDV